MASATIQGKIYDVLKDQLSTADMETGESTALFFNGNADHEYETERIQKTAQFVLERNFRKTGDVTQTDAQEQFDVEYQTYIDIILGLNTNTDFQDLDIYWIREVEGSPEYDLRDSGSRDLTMRISFNVRYWHDARDSATQTKTLT